MMLGRSGSATTEATAGHAGSMHVLRLLAIAALVAVVVLLAVDNRQEVTVGWLVDEYDMPLYLLFVGTFALGILVGLIAAVRHRRH